MEQVWLFDRLALAVFRIDFLDPALIGEPDARERGVRIEIKPSSTSYDGTVYSSSTNVLGPAVCRIDLLESNPHAADRMHWHPTMADGEPGERVFDPALSADPLAWVTERLGGRGGVAAHVEEIVEEVARGLDWARRPWPSVEHDERGLAVDA